METSLGKLATNVMIKWAARHWDSFIGYYDDVAWRSTIDGNC